MNSLVISSGARPAAAETADYDALMRVLQDRVTTREFDPSYKVPQAHYDMILQAASLAPSGANAQPWHFVIVTSSFTKRAIADFFVADQARQARPGLQAVNYAGLASAPGFIVAITDPRMSWAYPGLMDGSELDQRYHANAEKITLQSVAASIMAAHLAAAALGYQTWWVSVLGQDEARAAIQALLGVPEDLRITDFMLFGPSLLPTPKRWKKQVGQIASFDNFNMDNYKSVEQIDEWMRDLRHGAIAGSEMKKLK
jgi:nitroreductase